jgi:hypothetical protein
MFFGREFSPWMFHALPVRVLRRPAEGDALNAG